MATEALSFMLAVCFLSVTKWACPSNRTKGKAFVYMTLLNDPFLGFTVPPASIPLSLCLHMSTREHSVTLLVNVKDLVGVDILGWKNTKQVDSSQTPHG
jgi:hypothetical protein